MAGPYRHEPLIPATIRTAVANVAILRTQANSKGWRFTPDQSNVAIRIAVQFQEIVAKRAARRTMQ